MKLNKGTEKKLVETIFGDYELVQQGESNNGAFYTFEKDSIKRHVKIVDKEKEEEEGLDERSISELASGSDHIARLIETGDLSDRYGYLVFEYISGRDLGKIQKLNKDQLLKLAKQITEAIEYMWSKGVVHRDIKPGNIMLGDDGNFYLVDLGIGYFMETPDRNNTKTKGSRYYSSPEQFFASTDSRIEITFASDLYSLGMVLFEKATGNHPKATWTSKHNGYGELITQTEPPTIESLISDLPKELIIFINKSLQVYKIDRFITPRYALNVLNNAEIEDDDSGKVYLHDYSNNYSYIDPYISAEEAIKPDAIIVNVLQGSERLKTLEKMGYEVIVDPITYRLPHPLSSGDALKKKYGYKTKATFDADRINLERDDIIHRVLEQQKKSKIFILPYFAIESLDDPFLSVNKMIWLKGKLIAKELDEFKKVYGGIVIPASVTKETRSTDKLINLIHSKYDIDGYYVIFESPDDKVMAIDSITFLTNIRKIMDALSSMGEVIVANADISYMMLCGSQALVYGWSNSKRRFNYDSELYGKSSGWMPKDFDPKLLYYIPQLMTLVKGEEELETIYTFAPRGAIECRCDACVELSPYDGITPKQLDLAARHYFKNVVEQRKKLNGTKATKVSELNDAIALTQEIKKLSRNTVGSKLIPNHEAILSVVNN